MIEKTQKKLKDIQSRVDDFAEILDNIESIQGKKKLLWKEIYENAVTDRQNAFMLFTSVYTQMTNNVTEHATLGTTMVKYLERMCKSNEQLIKLAELIAQEEDKSSRIDADELFSEIEES